MGKEVAARRRFPGGPDDRSVAQYHSRRHPRIESRQRKSLACRSRLWKASLQRLANLTGFKLDVSHFPPGTSKWNKIEHRMFSFITQNCRATPVVSYQTIIQLISNTKTMAGLKIKAMLTRKTYSTGIEVTTSEMTQLNLKPDAFHGAWNYSVSPQ
jgi:hypothetical protein